MPQNPQKPTHSDSLEVDSPIIPSKPEETSTSSADAPATGYVYATDNSLKDESDDVTVASDSLTRQLLRDGDVVERKSKGVAFRPGTVVGGIKGSRASDSQLTPDGKPVLPSASRITEVSRHQKKTVRKKNFLPLSLIGALGLLTVGGVAVAAINPGYFLHKDSAQTVESGATALETAVSPSPTASASSVPAPSIATHVPEVKYLDSTDEVVDQGDVEYVDAEPFEETIAATPEIIETPEPLITTVEPEFVENSYTAATDVLASTVTSSIETAAVAPVFSETPAVEATATILTTPEPAVTLPLSDETTNSAMTSQEETTPVATTTE